MKTFLYKSNGVLCMQLPRIYNANTAYQLDQYHSWVESNIDNCGTNTYYYNWGGTYVWYNGAWQGGYQNSGNHYFSS